MKTSSQKKELESTLKERHFEYFQRLHCVGIVLTDTCPVGCRHCINQSPMHSYSQPTLEKQMQWLAEIAKEKACNTINITGGEPFSDFPRLIKLTETIVALGMHPSLVTSGFWATETSYVISKLDALKRAGLKGLAVSSDIYHQEKIPISNVIEIIRGCKSIGIPVGVAFTCMAHGEELARNVQLLKTILGQDLMIDVKVISGSMIKAGRANSLPWVDTENELSEPDLLICPAIGLLVKTDGSVVACCGAILPNGSPLILGNLDDEDFSSIYLKYNNHPLIPFIETWGLAKMRSELVNAHLAHNPLLSLVHTEENICQICQAMLSDQIAIEFFRSLFKNQEIKKQLGIMRLLMYGDHRILSEAKDG